MFYSPIVLFSWAAVTDALIDAGLVERVDGTHYVTDFPRLIELIDAGTPWSEIGLPQLPGQVAITAPDPTTTNAGNSFAGLLADTYNGGRLIDGETIDEVIERLRAHFARVAPLRPTSGTIFERYIADGMPSYPIIAGYESSIIEFKLDDEEALRRIQEDVRILYPRPTVWSSHQMIALTPNGEKLLAALHDGEIQRLAWSRHGFRSGLFIHQEVPDILVNAGIPAIVDSVMPLPRVAVMDRIIEGLRTATEPVDADVLTPRRWHLPSGPPALRGTLRGG